MTLKTSELMALLAGCDDLEVFVQVGNEEDPPLALVESWPNGMYEVADVVQVDADADLAATGYVMVFLGERLIEDGDEEVDGVAVDPASGAPGTPDAEPEAAGTGS